VKSIFMVMPTWKNEAMCAEAIRTLYEYTNFEEYGDLLVVANSEVGSEFLKVCQKYDVEIYTPEENLGWMRSINYGLDDVCATRPFFTMCNDDVVFPQDKAFWPRTLKLFDDPKVAGVGPTSNYVMGWQHYQVPVGDQVGEVNLLVGFCATYRTAALRQVGILDTELPGGDDLDLSIRMRAAGYKLLCDRTCSTTVRSPAPESTAIGTRSSRSTRP
jgi:GT2 family glycosyltransferase